MISLVRNPGEINLKAMGKRLQDAREDLGLLRNQLDDGAGVGRGSVHRIENAQRPEISAMILGKLAAYLGIKVDHLMYGGEEPAPSRAMPPILKISAATFLGQVRQLPGNTSLLHFIESKVGSKIPLHVLAEGMAAYYANPPRLDENGAPVTGWAAFFGAARKDGVKKNHAAGRASVAARKARRPKKPSRKSTGADLDGSAET